LSLGYLLLLNYALVFHPANFDFIDQFIHGGSFSH